VERRVANYGNERIREKEPLLLDTISTHVNEEKPNAFKEFASTPEYEVNERFRGSRKEMKRIDYVVYKEPDWRLEFKANLINERIAYNEERDEIIIQDVPQELAEEIQRH